MNEQPIDEFRAMLRASESKEDRMEWAVAVQTVMAMKDGPCIDCGGTFPRCAMDFDHVRGEKRFTIAQATNGTRGYVTANPLAITVMDLFTEVSKCQIRCSNCHRIATSERRQKGRTPKHLPGCIDCGNPIVRQSKKGRTPKRCSDCRTTSRIRTINEWKWVA